MDDAVCILEAMRSYYTSKTRTRAESCLQFEVHVLNSFVICDFMSYMPWHLFKNYLFIANTYIAGQVICIFVFEILMSWDLVSWYQISSETLVTTTKQRIYTAMNSLTFIQCSSSSH
jgi:hypothetical protein